jgi:hypothetical protein
MGNRDSVDTVLLTGADIYGIAVEDLESSGREVDNWLNALCAAVPFERFTDTKKMIEDFSWALGANTTTLSNF